jgi:MFS family permease
MSPTDTLITALPNPDISMDSAQHKTSVNQLPDIPSILPCDRKTHPENILPKIPKGAIRTSLRASTIDGVFATVFSITTTGILLSNFLVELGASPVVFGMVSSIPMIVNLIQPLGAYLSERTTSRFHYALWTFGISRLLWIGLVVAIGMAGLGLVDSHQLIILTLIIVLATNLLGALGSASWLSWMAEIVPRRLRGRYFGIRNTISSFTNFVCVPLAGVAVSMWYGGTLQGYGVILAIGILSGIISIACQHFKIDINPQEENSLLREAQKTRELEEATEVGEYIVSSSTLSTPPLSILKNANFLRYLTYFGLWMFAVNLSAPFFNLYMLDTLSLDVSLVTLYGSLQAGANLLLMILWGRLADKIGNRPILLVVGVLVAATPILWLGVGSNNSFDVFLWLPLLHVLTGGTWAAIDLCSNNLQIGVAPLRNQSRYFGTAAAVAGVTGALGTTIGSFLAENSSLGGLTTLFALSGVCRLVALVPLFFIEEPYRKSLSNIFQEIWGSREWEVRS